jgi:hypothetical protein
MPHRLPAPAFSTKNKGYFTAVALALLAACSHNKEARQRPDAAATPPSSAPTGAKLSQLNVFVDMSGGMQGFVHPVAAGATGSGFQQTVTELLSAVNAQKSAQPAYYFFKESTPADARLLVPSTYAAMRSTISGGLKNAARGSELPQMLSEALKLQAKKPGTVSLLISDFIFAPKDKGQTWDAKTFIKDALNEVEPAKLAVSVFANTSDYRGNFYPGNRTGPQKLTGEPVPYYIWVLGDPALVAQADAGLLRKLAGQPQAHYNVDFAPPYAVLDYLDPTGSWMVPTPGAPGETPRIVFTKKPTAGQPAEAVIGLNLNPLPPSQASQASLKTLRLDAPDAAPATLVRVWPLTQEPAAKAQPALTKYTHFARLRFAGAPATRATLRLEMARPTAAWIATYSTNSDSNLKAQGPKTFHLREVLAGVDEYFASEPSAQRLFSLPVEVETRR